MTRFTNLDGAFDDPKIIMHKVEHGKRAIFSNEDGVNCIVPEFYVTATCETQVGLDEVKNDTKNQILDLFKSENSPIHVFYRGDWIVPDVSESSLIQIYALYAAVQFLPDQKGDQVLFVALNVNSVTSRVIKVTSTIVKERQ